MLKREWGAESNGKLPHLFISSKTATMVPEFAMEDLPLDRIAALVTEFAVKNLPLDRTLMMMIMICTSFFTSILNFLRLYMKTLPLIRFPFTVLYNIRS